MGGCCASKRLLRRFMSMSPNGFTVDIVNWNHVDELSACLRSLYDGGADAVQVVVVDNGSADGSVAMVQRDFPRVELIETGANLGLVGGVERGIAAARGEWLMTLNNDAALIGDGRLQSPCGAHVRA